ncbi:hypothetical protein EG68_08749 [Paragonimus skrjabini miyazakii]|uniref:Uncharacterized protein n=1 Tax=Paragonimus skrjabini miyazakii TaxID=59628 RepID=A0A8S9YZ55_9TREM|nr:hypothetical protein EG68_08749 [Paragonimus skrjabini miyazakii]
MTDSSSQRSCLSSHYLNRIFKASIQNKAISSCLTRLTRNFFSLNYIDYNWSTNTSEHNPGSAIDGLFPDLGIFYIQGGGHDVTLNLLAFV